MILEPSTKLKKKKRDMITVFWEEGLFLGSKSYTTGVENEENKIDLI